MLYNAKLATLLAIAALSLLSCISPAQYWFQSGAIGGISSSRNRGASVLIETVGQQQPRNGSFGFWVGENLADNAFVQVGYQVPSTTGLFPTGCSSAGCNGTVLLYAGKPSWFWEYFPSGYNGSAFYGSSGPEGSAGAPGTINNYSFLYSGGMWRIYFNGERIGEVALGASGSGDNPPIAAAEYANAPSANAEMNAVAFKDLAYYNGTAFRLVPTGYAYIEYGKGSMRSIPNPYGVSEIGAEPDYFEVGSGLPLTPNRQLWSIVYTLDTVSPYSNISGVAGYSAGTPVEISAPAYAYVAANTREVFSGWLGTGNGSYTGSENDTVVYMDGNITERALWRAEYLITASSPYGVAAGGGWYANGSTATISVPSNTIEVANGTRAVFSQWSTGANSTQASIEVGGPENVSALWRVQYALNLSTPFGAARGAGWYDAGSEAKIALTQPLHYVSSGTRYLFSAWSNGVRYANTSIRVTGPLALGAMYHKQYLVVFDALDAYGNSINVTYVGLAGIGDVPSHTFLNASGNFVAESVMYKGVPMRVDEAVVADAPHTVEIALPVYNVAIGATGILGGRLNATLDLRFLNGTEETLHTGARGALLLRDVPYGAVNGSISYAGIRYRIGLSGGAGAVYIFVTPAPAAIAVAAIAAISVYLYLAKRRKRLAPADGAVQSKR